MKPEKIKNIVEEIAWDTEDVSYMKDQSVADSFYLMNVALDLAENVGIEKAREILKELKETIEEELQG